MELRSLVKIVQIEVSFGFFKNFQALDQKDHNDLVHIFHLSGFKDPGFRIFWCQNHFFIVTSKKLIMTQKSLGLLEPLKLDTE